MNLIHQLLRQVFMTGPDILKGGSLKDETAGRIKRLRESEMSAWMQFNGQHAILLRDYQKGRRNTDPVSRENSIDNKRMTRWIKKVQNF
jgi:hypothetical protein